MFARQSQNEAVSRRSLRRFSPIAFINIFLVFALLATSCGPSKETPRVELKVAGVSTVTRRLNRPGSDYTPPVFTHPEPMTVDLADLDAQAVAENPPAFDPQARSEAAQAYVASKLDYARKLVQSHKQALDLSPTADLIPAATLSPTATPTPQPKGGGGGFLPAPRRFGINQTSLTPTPPPTPTPIPCDIEVSGSYTLTGTHEDELICITGNLTISGATLIDTVAWATGTMTVTGSTLTYSDIWTEGQGTLTISNTIVNDSEVWTMAGGAINASYLTVAGWGDIFTTNGGSLTIDNSSFDDYEVFTVDGGTLTATTVNVIGGDFFTADGGTLTIDTGTFLDAEVFTADGGMMTTSNVNVTGGDFFADEGGDLTITNGTFNTEAQVFVADGGSMTADNLNIAGESALFVADGGSLTATNIYVTGESSVFTDDSGALTITDGTLEGSYVWTDDNGPFTLTDSTVSLHSWVAFGDLLTITNSNFLDTDIYAGEGTNPSTIHVVDALTTANSTFAANYTGDRDFVPAGLVPTNSDPLDHSAFLRTFADSNGPLTIFSEESLTSRNSTFWGSTVDSAGSLSLYNTILASDSGCGRSVTAGDHNVIDASSAGCGLTDGSNGNVIGSDAKLRALIYPSDDSQSYFELDAGSPALEAGNDSVCAAAPVKRMSQNALRRPQGEHCDIGSFEMSIVRLREIASSCPVDKCVDSAGGTGMSFGGPIHSHTGAYDYSVDDLSIPTSAGALKFTRDYSSQGVSQPTALSPGWTHNLASRLIMPDDPGGEEEVILFKLNSANLFTFYIRPDGTYLATPGLMASLVRQEGPPVRFVVTDAPQHVYTFDEDGVLLSYADSEGHTWEYSYNGGRLTQVNADGGSRSLSLHYDGLGRIERLSDHTGRSVSYHYDANGDLDSAIDVTNQTWRYEYSNHLMTRVVTPENVTVERTEYYPDGRAWKQFDGEDNLIVELIYNADGTTTAIDAFDNPQTLTYDLRHTLTNNSNQLGETTAKAYDYNFRPKKITDANGNATSLTWSANGANLRKVVDALGNETDIHYDALNNPTWVVDPLDRPTQYQYDGKLLTSSTDALGAKTTYTYTPEGFLASVRDARSRLTSYTYDSHGQRTSMTDPDGGTWEYSYDDLGRLVDTTDPLGRVQHNEYDNAGRLIRTTQNYDAAHPQNDENQYNIVTEYEYDERGNQVAVIDTYGRTTQTVYDHAGRVIQTIDPAGNTTTNTYNEAGQLVTTTDALGHETHYTYDGVGRQISVTDALGNTTHTAYNPDGTVASTTDALGHVTSYTYDELQRVETVTDPEGGVTRNTYDEVGNLVATTDPNGKTTRYEYDALGRMLRQTNPLGGVTENFYDVVGQLMQTIDPRGITTTYDYDNLGRLVETVNDWGGVTSYEYDEMGRRTAVIDPNGKRTEYEYDLLDRVVTVTDPTDHMTRIAYDALGNVLTRTDPLGNVTTYEYDELNRLEIQTDPLGGETSFTYDEIGNQLTITDPNGHVITSIYDALGRITETNDPNGSTTTSTYDAAGNLLEITDALGKTTTFAYDNLNRQVSITDPLGKVTEYDYDPNGNRVAMTDANRIVTAYEYDALNRMTAVVENYSALKPPDHETNLRTEYGYDEDGNLISIVDANGHLTESWYNELNLLDWQIDAMDQWIWNAYDDAGNLIGFENSNDVYTSYEYDDANRLIKIHTDNYGDSLTVPDISFAYDAAGRRTSMTDESGTTTWTYDDLNRVTAITDPFDQTVGYDYDAAGNKTALTYPGGQTISYGYDPANRLTTVTDGQSPVANYEYDAAGRVKTVGRPNGVSSLYNYYDNGWLQDIIHSSGSVALASYRYQYDNVGNRTQAIEMVNGTQPVGTVTVLVTSSGGAPVAGKTVYVFDGNTYAGYHRVTDANGEAAFTLLHGSYRFRVNVGGVEFWSGSANHCSIPGCTSASITATEGTVVTVRDTDGTPKPGLNVYAFNGSTYTGYTRITDEGGEAIFTLPAGSYRFRADLNGTQFWSGAENHCDLPGCAGADITVSKPVTLAVVDAVGLPKAGLSVYAFNGSTYTGYTKTTNENGQATFTLPLGSYRFRADANGTQFWSGTDDHCTLPGCEGASVMVTNGTLVTVRDTDGTPRAGLNVYAFNGSTYTGYTKTTDENGQVTFTLPVGSYRFRADLNGTQFWSGAENHCDIPGCSSAGVTVSKPVLVTVLDGAAMPKAGLSVYAFNGSTYTGFTRTTDENGQAVFTLPLGSYRFRVDYNGTQFWSGSADHCSIPGCVTSSVTVSKLTTVTVLDTDGTPQAGLNIYAFNGSTYTGYNKTTDENGQAIFALPPAGYRFRADFNGTQFWSGSANHCYIPGCSGASVTVTNGTLVTVQDTDGTPQAGVNVYAFNGSTYTGYTGTTDESGQAVFTLPLGSYRFRADFNGTQFWSGSTNHCELPTCGSVSVTVSKPILVSVVDTVGVPKAGLSVYAFNGPTYTGYTKTTNENGQAVFTLPLGSYRFRADLNGTQFWSGADNHCILPGCEGASVTVTNGTLVTVLNTDSTPQAGLSVYAFNGSTYTGYNKTTDENGQVTFTLPVGGYRFRADLNGTQFWSGPANHCTLPGCDNVQMAVTLPVTVTAHNVDGVPKAGLSVYAFNGSTYTSYTKTTDENGQAIFTLPLGSYRFRADEGTIQYWSGPSNHCTLPGCLAVPVLVDPSVTATPAPTEPPTATETPGGPTVTLTETSTLTLTPSETPTASETSVPTETSTETPTETPTPGPAVIVDEFEGPGLSSDWQWYVPKSGPTYSLSAVPGALRMSLPPGQVFEHWGTLDQAPQLRRTGVGGYSWALEARLENVDSAGGYVTGLEVGFNQMDQIWFGLENNGISAIRVNESYLFQIPKETPITFRLEKRGETYTFLYKGDSDPDWIVAGTRIYPGTPAYVGLLGRAFTASSTEIHFDWSYFRMEGWTTLTPVPVPSETPEPTETFTETPTETPALGGPVTLDEFDSPDLSGDWQWYVPKDGPTYSLSAVPGALRMSLPPGQVFEHWGTVDWAPQLRRTGVGGYSWALEARLENVDSGGGGYLAGLEVGFDQTNQVWFGLTAGLVSAIRVNDCCYIFQIPKEEPVTFRLEKYGETYTFLYKGDSDPDWIVAGTRTYPGTPTYVGLIGRVFWPATEEMHLDWSYFRMQGWTTQTPTPTPTLTPTATATFTRTAKPTPAIPTGPVTIDYVYDPIYRLKEANYSTGDYYHYTYDAVGNQLTSSDQFSSTNYQYDAANRLVSADGVQYEWDDIGNLLSDGVNTYTYDSANRLKQITQGGTTHTFSYNGLGDRIAQNGVHYTLDLNAGLTQVLGDGTNTYLYGLGRVAEQQGGLSEYYLGDALGSVRQLANHSGTVTLIKGYDPYGTTRYAMGDAQTDYGFTGEFTDPSGLVHLRARYYAPQIGRFTTRDSWQGDYSSPLSLNRWMYVEGNPVNYTDPSGMITEGQADEADKIVNSLRIHYNVIIQKDWGYRETIVYTVPEPISTGCHWEDGNWRSLRELRLVKQTVAKIAQKMGSESKFRSAMGTTTITRLNMQGYAMTVPQPINSLAGDLRIPNLLFDYSDLYAKYILTHELGHVWDFEKNYSLSKGLMQALGTWICDQNGDNCHWLPYAAHSVDPITNEPVWERPAGISLSCTGNPPLDCPEPYALGYGLSGQQPWESIFRYYEIMPGIEDWAESFANYVYPSYYASQRLSGLVPGGVRENYVRKQMDSLP